MSLKSNLQGVFPKLKPKQKVLLLIATGVAVVLAFYLYNVSSTVTVQFEVSPSLDTGKIGDTVDISINIVNSSNDIMKNADLQFSLPNGLILASGQKGKIQRIPLGEIGKDAVRTQDIKVVIVPIADNDPKVRDLAVAFNYSIGSLSAKFKQEKAVHLSVEDTALNLSTETPSSIVSGATFDTAILYDYEGVETETGLKIQIDYPKTFKKISASPETGALDNVWNLGSLAPGAKGKVTLTGSTILPNDSTLAMSAKVLINILGNDYAVVTKYINIAIAPAPLSLKIATEGGSASPVVVTPPVPTPANPPAETSSQPAPQPSPNQTTEPAGYRPGETINYVLSYANNTDIPLSAITIKAKLTGVMFDLSSIKVSGARFDPVSSTLTWDSNLSSALSSVSPNTTGRVAFSINLLPNYPIKKISDRNFIVKVDGQITSPTVPEGINASSITDVATLQTKVIGSSVIAALALFRDAGSLILNSGSLPPRIGRAINFTVHWQITNFATDVKNITVRAKLAPGVSFTGKTKSTIDPVPGIESGSGDVVWHIDRIAATTGIIDNKIEAIFQIKAIPSSSDLGNYMGLLGETALTATDDFTGANIMSASMPLTTRLESDPSVQENDGKVVP